MPAWFCVAVTVAIKNWQRRLRGEDFVCGWRNIFVRPTSKLWKKRFAEDLSTEKLENNKQFAFFSLEFQLLCLGSNFSNPSTAMSMKNISYKVATLSAFANLT